MAAQRGQFVLTGGTRAKRGRARIGALAAALLAAAPCACHRASAEFAPAEQSVAPLHIKTWAATGAESPPALPLPALEERLPPGAFPVAGTVSHHLLAGVAIDAWFSELAAHRAVRRFFIISPSHYGLSVQPWSLADCAWDCGARTVATDSAAESALARALGVPYDEQPFPFEHGINTLIPYIATYFPGSDVCAVAVQCDPPLNTPARKKLADALKPYFSDGAERENFLLISTDFSHHGNPAQTAAADESSRRFFAAPSPLTAGYACCDNHPGIDALASLAPPSTRAAILCHTDSYALSGYTVPEDITSYFFSFLY